MEERKDGKTAEPFKNYWNEFKDLETLEWRIRAAEGMRTCYDFG